MAFIDYTEILGKHSLKDSTEDLCICTVVTQIISLLVFCSVLVQWLEMCLL